MKEYVNDEVLSPSKPATQSDVGSMAEPAEENKPLLPVTETLSEQPPIEERTAEVNNPEESERRGGEIMAEEKDEENSGIGFEEHWKKMADICFGKLPTVYYTVKEYLPEIVEGMIYIKVKNELQKELIEGKIREMLAYLRNHFSNEIQNIEVLVDEQLESKVRIMDAGEKLRLLNEQNNSLPEFLKILNLVVKD